MKALVIIFCNLSGVMSSGLAASCTVQAQPRLRVEDERRQQYLARVIDGLLSLDAWVLEFVIITHVLSC